MIRRDGYVPGRCRRTSDLAFLPRTPDLVRTVNTPQVPAGFTKAAEANTGPGHGG
ncbi:hypothetical protein AB0F52_18320 [Amycolatopsis sp. NPDC024027]|uniref:hypothetical protein n=1 Tax=Amycolatopsis sp. NPDC024027 TaxID=3154327 RepID=UPI0033CC1BA2